MLHPALVVLFLAIMVHPLKANAADRRALDTEILDRVLKVENGLDLIRVYPSHRLVLKRSTPIGADVSVDEEVNLELNGKIRKDELKRGTPGKILSVDLRHEKLAKRVVVSFDKTCVTEECAFIFENPVEINRACNRWGCYDVITRKGDTFKLAGLPNSKVFSEIDSISIGRKPLLWSPLESNPKGYRADNILDSILGHGLRLEVDVDELMKIEEETLVHDGW